MAFLFKHGPWKELFKGNLETHPLEIYTNQNLELLVVLTEREGEKPIGMVLELFRVYSTAGELEKMLSSLNKETTAIIKHDSTMTEKFLIINSKPSYAEFNEERANIEMDLLMRNLDESSFTIRNVSRAYELTLTELKDAPDHTKEAFFSQPMLLQFISPKEPLKAVQATSEKPISFGEITLGITKEGIVSKEPMFYFKKTIISDGAAIERRHAMHLLIEGCLLSGASAIIIDNKNLFSGIVSPTKRSMDLEKFKIEIDPLGFPVKDFFANEQLKIGISTISPKGFVEAFGFMNNAASQKITELMQEKKFESIKDLSKALLEEETTGNFNDYQKNCAARFLKLAESIYENLWGTGIETREIAKTGIKGIGRATMLHTEKLDDRACMLLLDSVSNSLLEYFSREGITKNLRAIVFVPEALKFLRETEENTITNEIVTNFEKLDKYGVGIAIEAEKEAELQTHLRNIAEARITMVKGTDAGIHIKNQKSYRVYLRPALSTCTELQTLK